MGSVRGIAPIFAVRDLAVAMEHYNRLGFAVRAYTGGGYGYALRDGVEIHLGVVADGDNRTSSAYLFVDDADDLAEEWRSAGIQELHAPQDTDWGRHEGAVVDPDGNVIRFGSPLRSQPVEPVEVDHRHAEVEGARVKLFLSHYLGLVSRGHQFGQRRAELLTGWAEHHELGRSPGV